MMRQYRAIKEKHRDAILFFRLGDFYEMFERDAAEASALLDLTLTQRGGVPMCGIPYHAAQGYIARLLKAGRKIAICEQTHIPRSGLASREVTEVITPGTVVDENLLERSVNNYLLSIAQVGASISLAGLDLSTAEFFATSFAPADRAERLRKELLHLAPREILVQESLLEEDGVVAELLQEREGLVINRYPDWSFDLAANRAALERQLGVVNLKGFGLEADSAEIAAAGVILDYLGETSRGLLPHIRALKVYREDTFVGLDESTLRNLEIVQNLNDRTRRYTLLEVLDQARSAMGSRRLRSWLLKPLRDRGEIERRLDLVEFFYKNQVLLSGVRETLGRLLDLERLISRVALNKAHAKDLLAIKATLAAVLDLVDSLAGCPELRELLGPVAVQREGITAVVALLEESILEDPSLQINEGNLIKPGYNEELDRLRHLKENVREVLKGYLQRERERTGIASLKLRYNRIIGYYLEVTRPNLHLVPPHFIRKQTLVGTERYTSEELAAQESEINSASEKIVELERGEFLRVRERVRGAIPAVLQAAETASTVDVLQGFAFAATLHGYVRPRASSGGELHLVEGRHPVVEAHLPAGSFVPNDLLLRREGERFVLLTGPNMAGKSTFLRQTALIVLMAQAGSFVPAGEAELPLVDHIFCRVGATDNLARGESTFLVEMNETANILRSATPQSLVIMDEVGRGTGTNDGLAIAWAVTEYILEHVEALALFATHYHQLTALQHPCVANLSMSVVERDQEIIFLKKVQPGPADNSYGVHVAQLAGLPGEVIARARKILAELERTGGGRPAPPAPAAEPAQQGLLFSPGEVVCEEILSVDLSRTTPLEALNRLAAWQQELGKQERDGRR